MRQVATLQLTVTYDDDATDPEALASAADRLLETALSAPGILDDYGLGDAAPVFGEFEVALGPDV